MLDKIKQSNFGEHNLILYKDVATLNDIYLGYCKSALELLNEIILIIPYHESVSNIFHTLKNNGMDVESFITQLILI
jgi:hypothetical protein